MKEPVLLMDDDSQAFRVVVLRQPNIVVIIERVHVGASQPATRTWECSRGERALTGQRIFRELKPTPLSEPSESPLFDELKIKKPLPFTHYGS